MWKLIDAYLRLQKRLVYFLNHNQTWREANILVTHPNFMILGDFS